jgi:hypothetical protein
MIYTPEQTAEFKRKRNEATKLFKAVRNAYWILVSGNTYRHSLSGLRGTFHPAGRTLTVN